MSIEWRGVAVFAAGLVGCTAPVGPGAPPVELQTDLFAVHNGGEAPLEVTLTFPRLPLACDLLAPHPEIVEPALSSIEWGGRVQAQLQPGELITPGRLTGDDRLGWPEVSCGAMQVAVEGLGERILFDVEPTGIGRSFALTATLSELPEGVVTLVQDSNQVWRATSTDLMFEPTTPLPICDAPPWTGCDDCLREGVPGGMAFDYVGTGGTVVGIVASTQTVPIDGRVCSEMVVDLSLAPVPTDAVTARVCLPDAPPALPFEIGDEVSVAFTTTAEGDERLVLTGPAAVVSAATATGIDPASYDLIAPDVAVARCILDPVDCPALELEQLALDVPGVPSLLQPVVPGTMVNFTHPVGAGGVGGMADLTLWLDAARIPATASSDCSRPPVDLLTPTGRPAHHPNRSAVTAAFPG